MKFSSVIFTAVLVLTTPTFAQTVKPMDRHAAFLMSDITRCADRATSYYHTEWCQKYRANIATGYEVCKPVRRAGETGQNCIGGPAARKAILAVTE